MSSGPQKTRRPRKDALYSRAEMVVINRHKEEYRQQTTRELRANVLKTKILVDLFNFWLEQGKAPDNEEESIARMKVEPFNRGTSNHLLIIPLRNSQLGSGTTGALTRLLWRPSLKSTSMLSMSCGKCINPQ